MASGIRVRTDLFGNQILQEIQGQAPVDSQQFPDDSQQPFEMSGFTSCQHKHSRLQRESLVEGGEHQVSGLDVMAWPARLDLCPPLGDRGRGVIEKVRQFGGFVITGAERAARRVDEARERGEATGNTVERRRLTDQAQKCACEWHALETWRAILGSVPTITMEKDDQVWRAASASGHQVKRRQGHVTLGPRAWYRSRDGLRVPGDLEGVRVDDRELIAQVCALSAEPSCRSRLPGSRGPHQDDDAESWGIDRAGVQEDPPTDERCQNCAGDGSREGVRLGRRGCHDRGSRWDGPLSGHERELDVRHGRRVRSDEMAPELEGLRSQALPPGPERHSDRQTRHPHGQRSRRRSTEAWPCHEPPSSTRSTMPLARRPSKKPARTSSASSGIRGISSRSAITIS